MKNESTSNDAINSILDLHFSEIREDRLAGSNRKHCSGYTMIRRFFGPEGIDPGQINIIHENDTFQFDDKIIASYAHKYEQELRTGGRLTDGPPVTKLVSLGSETSLDPITIQRANYGQFAGSCFCLDRPDDRFGPLGNLRRYYLSKQNSTNIGESPLASCFGISGLVLIQEPEQSFVLRVRRSARLATMTGSYGASVAGVVDYYPEVDNLWEMMQTSLSQEVEEEINLRGDEYRILPLAYTHELYRGEHPQLFCLVSCRLTRQELTERLLTVSEEQKEFDKFDFVPVTDGVITQKGVVNQFNFEGKMSYFLAEEFLADQQPG